MATYSFQLPGLPVHLPSHHQNAFVPFRFQGQTIANVAKQADLPAVSRVHFTRSNANVFYERWRPLFVSACPERSEGMQD